MQFVSSFMNQAGGQQAAAAGTFHASSAAGSATGSSSSVLKALGIGGSVVSAISSYAMSRQRAAAMKTEAADEEMSARQEYVQANDAATSIMDEYNRTVSAQRAAVAASGLDVASGSVEAQRLDYQATADRQIGILDRGADLQARVRRTRAAQLRASAKQESRLGLLSAVGQLAMSAASAGRIG